MAVRIRAADDADAAALADLLVAARHAAVPAVPSSVHDDDDVRSWVRTVVVPTYEVWLVEPTDGGEPLGLLVLGDDMVEQLYVAPDRTGEGLGSLLLDHAKARRPDGLQLWTFQSNAGAQRFYERHGFVEVERTDGRDNEERAPDIRYAWS